MAVEKEKRKRITKKFKQEQLAKIYNHSFKNILEIDESVFASRGNAFYNEIAPQGARSLIDFFSKQMGKKAVFYDLGSGQGKLIMHLAIETKMSKIVGIELSKERYERSIEIASEVEFPFTQPQILNADFHDVDLSDATIVYFDNSGYTKEETSLVFSKLPPGCLVIYQRYGQSTGDPFLPVSTVFGMQDFDDELIGFWAKMASYRFLGV